MLHFDLMFPMRLKFLMLQMLPTFLIPPMLLIPPLLSSRLISILVFGCLGVFSPWQR